MKQKSTKTTMTFRLDKELKRQIRKAARQTKFTPSAYLARLVSAILEHKEQAND
jgi:predicted transcriptional regulator